MPLGMRVEQSVAHRRLTHETDPLKPDPRTWEVLKVMGYRRLTHEADPLKLADQPAVEVERYIAASPKRRTR